MKTSTKRASTTSFCSRRRTHPALRSPAAPTCSSKNQAPAPLIVQCRPPISLAEDVGDAALLVVWLQSPTSQAASNKHIFEMSLAVLEKTCVGWRLCRVVEHASRNFACSWRMSHGPSRGLLPVSFHRDVVGGSTVTQLVKHERLGQRYRQAHWVVGDSDVPEKIYSPQPRGVQSQKHVGSPRLAPLLFFREEAPNPATLLAESASVEIARSHVEEL